MSYRQIADDLIARIRAREYAPGDQLPSITQLAEIYDVSRATVVRALGLLAFTGLTYSEAGRGVFVADRSAD